VVQVLDSVQHSLFASAVDDCQRLDFGLPPALEAGEPPEARGLNRDEVRLMVSHYTDDHILHTGFRHIGEHLERGDVLVINTSGTMNAALRVSGADELPLELHLSTRLPADLWVVELRQPDDKGSRPFYGASAGQRLALPGGGTVILHVPYRSDQRGPQTGDRTDSHIRLWVATLDLPSKLEDYLARYGFPIRYSYIRQPWPSSFYQTVYATELGSAEMPSAGRPFTPHLLAQLRARGVHIAPLILHTGVASLEDHEPPYEEYYRVPLATARVVNRAKEAGRRVVAVGTTAVRALETVADVTEGVHPGQGWTDLVVTPQRGLRVIDALLTGLHEPHASHLAMLEALTGACHLNLAYAEAIEKGYLWHEFGDLHLILP
jgi:S-adenosylmethionine:tRNA ribosyltransferase-isomerase